MDIEKTIPQPKVCILETENNSTNITRINRYNLFIQYVDVILEVLGLHRLIGCPYRYSVLRTTLLCLGFGATWSTSIVRRMTNRLSSFLAQIHRIGST